MSNFVRTFTVSIGRKAHYNFGKSSRGHSEGLPKIFWAPIYRAHRAVVFAIAHVRKLRRSNRPPHTRENLGSFVLYGYIRSCRALVRQFSPGARRDATHASNRSKVNLRSSTLDYCKSLPNSTGNRFGA